MEVDDGCVRDVVGQPLVHLGAARERPKYGIAVLGEPLSEINANHGLVFDHENTKWSARPFPSFHPSSSWAHIRWALAQRSKHHGTARLQPQVSLAEPISPIRSDLTRHWCVGAPFGTLLGRP